MMDFLDLTWPYYLFHQLPWVPRRVSWTKEDSLAARLGHRDLLALPELRELSWALASILWRRPGGYLTVRHGKWPIGIDGLPIKNGWIFPWRTVSHNQMVTMGLMEGLGIKFGDWWKICAKLIDGGLEDLTIQKTSEFMGLWRTDEDNLEDFMHLWRIYGGLMRGFMGIWGLRMVDKLIIVQFLWHLLTMWEKISDKTEWEGWWNRGHAFFLSHMAGQ